MKTLVLAVGNTLLADEGVGIHVLQALQSSYPELENVTWMDGGTLSFTLAGAVGEADNLIVIDAARLQGKPGSVRCLLDQDMDKFLGACKRSVHEVGLLDLLDISRLTGCLPQRRALIGIQPEKIDWGDCLTPEVEKAVPVAMRYVMDLIAQWQPRECIQCPA